MIWILILIFIISFSKMIYDIYRKQDYESYLNSFLVILFIAAVLFVIYFIQIFIYKN